MKLLKVFFFTILYCVFNGLVWIWFAFAPEELYYTNVIYGYDFINSSIFLFVLTIIFTVCKRKDVLEFHKTKPKFYILAIFLGIGFVFFQAFLNLIYHFKLSYLFVDYNFSLSDLQSFNALAYTCIIPITEELFFRNYIQRELTQKYHPYLAITLASLLFAFIHLQIIIYLFHYPFIDWHHAYITLFGGLISGVLLYKSKSIVPSILFHICWNITVSVV
ncbi:MAG: type II CAAX endopeptidase family protein [Bacteroidota bacterium]